MSSFKFRYFIVCDDIRQESGGKSTLVGVYDGNLVLPFFPIVTNKLVFRVSVMLLKDDSKEFTVKIRSEDDRELLGASHAIINQASGDIINVQIFAQMVSFQAPTRLKVFFGLDDEELVQVDDFVVRAPKNDQERQQSREVNPTIGHHVSDKK